jgi:hypothetical protein
MYTVDDYFSVAFLCSYLCLVYIKQIIFKHLKMLYIKHRYSFLLITALCIMNLCILQFIFLIDYLKLHTSI